MLKQAALIALLGMSASAMAGQWQVKVGGSVISPTGDTETALGTVKADDELAFTPSVEYFFNDNISAELLLATPIGHDVLLDGDKAAKIKHLPPTITAKYNFKNSTRFTPYIGVGGTAFVAWDESGAAKNVKEDFGFAGQVGFNYQPADAKNWGVYFDARYAQLSPEVTLIDELGGGKFDLDIDPMVYTIGYSYKF
ncbi:MULTISPECIES: OmpW/AlkL family protein [Acinetobacter]|uniref:OmpW/AlkL family protein n=1 Tax=Acinetobacter TaxID=469 RepID=UPI0015D24127|nr:MULTISPECIES: OmpW family outer membrane protein [Acinetobacter]MCL6231264.1 outer membrane beta-barrel protein [Acinetobacter amyesii]MCL6234860.1 outer membrane beta-barrel protein [Acinetobacter amyesii]MCL6237612.1 outer membrane beta-barrel protein [Acinetobacter amyesii]MCL6241198.1 outer membrane beta-barrel protein [Acinetobacter amyesii]UIJ75461.1 outer membrane beta-barrel protein [Acinetobacter sp. SH20PTE14]